MKNVPSAVKSSNYSMGHLPWNHQIAAWAICHEIVKSQDGPPRMKLSNHSMGQLPWNRQITAWTFYREIVKLQQITVHAAANDALQEIIRHEASSNRVKFFVAGLPRSFADESYTFPNENEDEFSCTHLPLSGPTYTFLHAEKDQALCAYLSLRSSPHVSTHVHPSMKTTIRSIQTCLP
jgi:hypothetical protein